MKFIVVLALLAAVTISATSAHHLCLPETNSARRGQPFTYDARLAAAAKAHNDYMARHRCFSHQCPAEISLGQRVTNAGYRWRGVAENIAAGSRDCSGSVKQWMNSAGHRRNILGSYREVGCAVANCNCNFGKYWTCVYANPM